jgi:4-amino-4-deoxy-L-arabinose transferase-like glycosyltransferase
MSESWRAFLYGGYDSAASITLDKLPGAFQVEALSARVFGFSTWSVLLPQVVETVIAVLVLYGVVRRWLGPPAGLLAAAAFATTPVVAALAHAEVPDTLLTLLLILAADAWQRALARGRLGWLLLSGVWVGLAFQTKMVQAWAVLPALAVVYLLAAPGLVRRRLGQVGLAGLVTVAVSMSWIVLVLLTPAASRPYVDGSLNNSPLSMVFEYNLLNRYGLGGDSAAALSAPGGDRNLMFMFADQVASQVGWLYPLALIGLVTGIWVRGRAPRTDVTRAGFLMWGLWLAVYAVAFSTGEVAHSFYVIALAPAVAALAGGGVVVLWRAYRRGGWQRWLLPATVVASVAWAAWLSRRFSGFLPWLAPSLVALGAVALALLVAAPLAGPVRRQPRRRFLTVGAALAGGAVALVAMFVAPAGWAASTVGSRYSGTPIAPAAGPVNASGAGQWRPGRGGAGPAAAPAPYGVPAGGQGAAGGQNQPPSGGGLLLGGPASGLGPGGPGAAPGGPGAAPAGGDANTPQLVAWLKSHQPGSKYLVAAPGRRAGQLILAGASVLPMGGFSGQIPFPSTDTLAKLVAEGKLRYALIEAGGPAPGDGGAGPGRDGSPATTTWVTSHCTAVTDSAAGVPGLYDCAHR